MLPIIIAGIECKYKIWYVGKCHRNGTEVVHLILSKGGLNCTVSKQILQECDYVTTKNRTVQVPEDAPLKNYLTHGDHTKIGLQKMLNRSV